MKLRRMALTGESWQSLALHAAMAAAAAALTYITQNATGTDLGQYTVVIVAGLTIALNYLNKVIQNDSTSVGPAPPPIPVPAPIDPTQGTDFPLD